MTGGLLDVASGQDTHSRRRGRSAGFAVSALPPNSDPTYGDHEVLTKTKVRPLRAPNRKPGRSHIPFPAESAVLREALGPELYEAVLAVRRAEAELFAMFTDADVIEAVRRRC
ncbi:hypothetical protein SAMN05428944_7894 [Streptomyces sp. 1222.5]|nr:hypothetical protein BX260_0190 [Streptomyces sp. 5112.2]SED50022.1 hypothetical protein SAMN05428944_7894 [Streptomyces sp. 1222.5]